MIEKLSDDQIEFRLTMIEGRIRDEKDPKNLPTLNKIFQKLLDEQVKRDLEKQKK